VSSFLKCGSKLGAHRSCGACVEGRVGQGSPNPKPSTPKPIDLRRVLFYLAKRHSKPSHQRAASTTCTQSGFRVLGFRFRVAFSSASSLDNLHTIRVRPPHDLHQESFKFFMDSETDKRQARQPQDVCEESSKYFTNGARKTDEKTSRFAEATSPCYICLEASHSC